MKKLITPATAALSHGDTEHAIHPAMKGVCTGRVVGRTFVALDYPLGSPVSLIAGSVGMLLAKLIDNIANLKSSS